ncbi:MAG: metallophosphoesterase [Clostridia bacterium]|nr:metallophosphoesterase [Clostridia bacterium]
MKKTKTLKIFIFSFLAAILLSLVTITYFVLPFWVSQPAKASSITAQKRENLLVSSANEIKILQLTDLHVNGAFDLPLVYSTIKKAINAAQPDLIVVTGDLFSRGCRESDVSDFFDFMKKFELPWASVLGNHDDETPYSLAALSAKLEEADYSLFQTGNLTDLYGNYDYLLQFADGNVFHLIFMDSRIDGFTEESVAFYERVVGEKATLNGGSPLNNFLFYHIPLPEQNLAVAAYEADASIGVGKIGETPCVQSGEVNFFEKVLEWNATKAMIYGHDHVNNTIIRYRGVDFCYGTKTGPSSYEDITRMGGNVYRLRSDGTYTAEILTV